MTKCLKKFFMQNKKNVLRETTYVRLHLQYIAEFNCEARKVIGNPSSIKECEARNVEESMEVGPLCTPPPPGDVGDVGNISPA